MIKINMNKAREIKREQIRLERTPLLEKLDVDFMRAVEAGDMGEQELVATKKQELRDATQDPAIEAATTPEELKSVVPSALEAE